MIAEPQRLRWTLALADPEVLSGPVTLSPSPPSIARIGDGRVSYRVSTAAMAPPADDAARHLNLQLPASGNPKARPTPWRSRPAIRRQRRWPPPCWASFAKATSTTPCSRRGWGKTGG